MYDLFIYNLQLVRFKSKFHLINQRNEVTFRLKDQLIHQYKESVTGNTEHGTPQSTNQPIYQLTNQPINQIPS